MSQKIKEKYWSYLQHSTGAWEFLDQHYSEPHRAYHAWNHIGDMLKKLNNMRHLATRPDLVAIAIFWHDVIYKTQNDDGSRRPDAMNVEESMIAFLRHTELRYNDVSAVCDMIMATAHHTAAKPRHEYYPGFSKDLDLFLDLDLSALGAAWRVFERNTDNIRFEYHFVPAKIFYTTRANVLEGFHKAGERLFRRDETAALWEDKAHKNLARSVSELRAKAAKLEM